MSLFFSIQENRCSDHDRFLKHSSRILIPQRSCQNFFSWPGAFGTDAAATAHRCRTRPWSCPPTPSHPSTSSAKPAPRFADRGDGVPSLPPSLPPSYPPSSLPLSLSVPAPPFSVPNGTSGAAPGPRFFAPGVVGGAASGVGGAGAHCRWWTPSPTTPPTPPTPPPTTSRGEVTVGGGAGGGCRERAVKCWRIFNVSFLPSRATVA